MNGMNDRGRDAATVLRFSAHARERMTQRGITDQEVDEALGNAYRTEIATASTRIQDVLSSGEALERVDVSGETGAGRHLRVSRPRAAPDLVISVVELEDSAPAKEAR
jgi:hypothetical protein